MVQVIFVCTGNICRSPMAEGILRHKCLIAGRDDCIISSMGIQGLDNSPASEYVQIICEENGIDISSHRSRSLIFEELQQADIIFSMESVHREFLQTFHPWCRDKVFLLGAWPGKETRKSPIRDPYGGSLEENREIYYIINYHIDRILPML